MAEYKANGLQNHLRRHIAIHTMRTVPIIFANGRDDDLPGLSAAVENKRVRFNDRVYEPGEYLNLGGQTLNLACRRIIVCNRGETQYLAPLNIDPSSLGPTVQMNVPANGRRIELHLSRFIFGHKVEP